MSAATYSPLRLFLHAKRVEALLTGETPPSGYYHLAPDEAKIAALALSLLAHASPLIVQALEHADDGVELA